jgi:hypothetical protein
MEETPLNTPDKKKIYMVQVDLAYGENNKAVYLPYAIGLLVAYAWQDETVRDMYELGRFVFTRTCRPSHRVPFDNSFSRWVHPPMSGTRIQPLFCPVIERPRFSELFNRISAGHNVPPDTSLLEHAIH